MKTGDKLRITTKNLCKEAKVQKIKEIKNEHVTGSLATLDIDGFGKGLDFWYPDGDILPQAYQSRSNRSFIPTEYTYKQPGDFEWNLYGENTEPQKKIVNAFITNFELFNRQGRGLYISSPETGSGKTLLACILGNEIMKRYDSSVKFINTIDYTELLRDKSEEIQEKKKAIKDCTVLIYDNIGDDSCKKDWIQSSILHLIDYREKRFLPIIYTSIYAADQLSIESRIVDRIISNSIEIRLPKVNIPRLKAEKENKDFIKSILVD